MPIQIHHYLLSRKLTDEGFVFDNDLTFRKTKGRVIEVVCFQKKTDDSGYFINLGCHLDFIPASPGTIIVSWDRLEQPQCDLQCRLTKNKEISDCCWSVNELNSQIVVESYVKTSKRFFGRLENYPEAWTSCSISLLQSGDFIDEFPGLTRVRAALLFARIYKEIGDMAKLHEFVNYGLSVCGKMAVGPRAALKALIVAS